MKHRVIDRTSNLICFAVLMLAVGCSNSRGGGGGGDLGDAGGGGGAILDGSTPTPDAHTPTTTTLCTETCRYTNDGECDDGGEGSLGAYCDLGSDCLDCGPRTTTSPSSELERDAGTVDAATTSPGTTSASCSVAADIAPAVEARGVSGSGRVTCDRPASIGIEVCVQWQLSAGFEDVQCFSQSGSGDPTRTVTNLVGCGLDRSRPYRARVNAIIDGASQPEVVSAMMPVCE